LKFSNNELSHRDKPAQWSVNHIQKSGDRSDEGDYRGIALSAIAAKIANKMILNKSPTRTGFTSASKSEWFQMKTLNYNSHSCSKKYH